MYASNYEVDTLPLIDSCELHQCVLEPKPCCRMYGIKLV